MVCLNWRQKKFYDMFSHFDRIEACDGRTDGRTDNQTARGTDILGQLSPRYAYASRDKSGYSCTREIVKSSR